MSSIAMGFDPKTVTDRLEQIRRFWSGEGRYLVTIQSSRSMYRQSFKDEAMVDGAVENIRHQATLPGVNLPAFFADFGTISTAKHWGGTPRFDSTGGNLFVDPVAETVEEALAMAPASVDTPELDPAHAIRLYRQVCERLGTDEVWLRTPDFQGTLNTAGLVMNQEEMLMAMASEPDEVHAFLDRVSRFLIEYADYLKRETKGRVCGNIWPYTFLPSDLGMSFTEDLMPLLSPEMYREFGIPQLERFSKAFGGLQIHCCGEWGRHAEALAASDAVIRAIEFHHPFTRMEELAPLVGQTVFVPYYNADGDKHGFPSAGQFYTHLLESADPAARFWFAFPDDNDDALEFVRRHGETG